MVQYEHCVDTMQAAQSTLHLGGIGPEHKNIKKERNT